MPLVQILRGISALRSSKFANEGFLVQNMAYKGPSNYPFLPQIQQANIQTWERRS